MNPPIFVTHPNGRERINVAYYSYIERDGGEINFTSATDTTYWYFESDDELQRCFDNIAYTLVNVYNAILINNVVMLPEVVRIAGVYSDEEGWFIDIDVSIIHEAVRFDFASEQQAIEAFHQIYQRL
jgi:hypothetical protein